MAILTFMLPNVWGNDRLLHESCRDCTSSALLLVLATNNDTITKYFKPEYRVNKNKWYLRFSPQLYS